MLKSTFILDIQSQSGQKGISSQWKVPSKASLTTLASTWNLTVDFGLITHVRLHLVDDDVVLCVCVWVLKPHA